MIHLIYSMYFGVLFLPLAGGLQRTIGRLVGRFIFHAAARLTPEKSNAGSAIGLLKRLERRNSAIRIRNGGVHR